MAEATLDQQFVEYVVKNLVDHPDDVVLERSIDDRGVLLKLSVHPDDMGKIIGKAGSTAKAIRTLLRVVGAKTDERLNLKIDDPEGSEAGGASGAVADADQAETPQDDSVATEMTEAEQEAESVAADGDVEVEAESEEAVANAKQTDAAGTEASTKDAKAKAREGLEDLDLDI